MTNSSCRLPHDVFLCLSSNRFVFLDLRNDQYLCLDRNATQIAKILFRWEHGVNDTPLTKEKSDDGNKGDQILDALAHKGLMALGDDPGKEISPAVAPRAERSAVEEMDGQRPSINAIQRVAFIRASLLSSWKLRSHSIRRIIRSIDRRKQRIANPQLTTSGSLDELTAIFHYLRPFYPRRYRCLYDSLSLVEFLSLYQVFPRWVFGVSTEPFAAHCWVQDGDCVLNDSVEYIRQFTPIMII